ncbi:MAG: site-specific DNA-methyltransferase, partial [Lamprobacter sp.]|nr:site-specific DNA-methyltransferase [Lamprobacter sp.]
VKANVDGEKRWRYILVQLPEPVDDLQFSTIAEISRERIRRACIGFQERLTDVLTDNAGIAQDLGFKVFKLSSSNIKPWDADFDSLDQDLVQAVDNIKPDRTEDDVLYELLLKYGLDLAIPTETRHIEGRKVTVIGAGALIVCLADDITLDVVSGIVALKAEFQPEVMRVVFKDAGFKDDVVKTNAAQILKQAGIDDVKSL